MKVCKDCGRETAQEHQNFCGYCGASLPQQLEEKVYESLYLNSSKDTLREQGDEIGLSDAAMEQFLYALYEVEFKCVIDTKTGDVEVESIHIGKQKFVPEDGITDGGVE